MRIAMWSGPRNLSTVMMYAFAARGDCAVWDEPFYGAYLAQTGIDHPLRAAILAEVETDPDRVASQCVSDPDGKPHVYQKHMTHHMVPGISRGWIAEVVNVFLIRHPARVIASYHAKRENPTDTDLGYDLQAELFDAVCQMTGSAPPVIDATDVRADPRRALSALCSAIGLPFTEAMLSWPAGGRPEDGPWAPHWYGAVRQSTGFAGPDGPLPQIPDAMRGLLDRALPQYERLRALAL